MAGLPASRKNIVQDLAAGEEIQQLRERVQELENELADERNTYAKLDDDWRKLKAEHESLQETTPVTGEFVGASLPADAPGLLANRLRDLIVENDRSTSQESIDGYAQALVESPISAWFHVVDPGHDEG